MNLKELRKQNQKTQDDLARALNVSHGTYNNYEQGKYEPNIDTIIKLANYYDVSIDYLVGRDYKNEIGYINETQKNSIKTLIKLNEINLMKATSYMLGLLATQN